MRLAQIEAGDHHAGRGIRRGVAGSTRYPGHLEQATIPFYGGSERAWAAAGSVGAARSIPKAGRIAP